MYRSFSFTSLRQCNCCLRQIASTAIAMVCLSTGGDKSLSAAEPQPGDESRVTVKTENGPATFIFRYCPAGQFVPGRQGPDARLTREVKPFYMMETEVTVDEFTRVAGADRINQVKERVGSDLADLIANGDLPVFSVRLDDIVYFCTQLEQLYKQSSPMDSSFLEQRRFRLPSHDEWQYACRAARDPAAGASLPHFNQWPKSYKILDRITQSKCEEEWKEMGRQDPFTGSQEQVVDILSQRSAPNNPKPLEILRAFMKAGIGVDRDYSIPPEPLPLNKPRSSRPNHWSIYDLHNNAREWTLTSTNQDEASEVWQQLASEEASRDQIHRRGLFFLAGGSFIDTASGSNGWMKFTIWGGFMMQIEGESVGLLPESGQVVPFSFRDVEETDLLAEQQPGFRIVMRRELRDDWLLVMRQRVVVDDSGHSQSPDAFELYRKTAQDLVTPERAGPISRILGFYQALAEYRAGHIEQANGVLRKLVVEDADESDPYLTALAQIVEADSRLDK